MHYTGGDLAPPRTRRVGDARHRALGAGIGSGEPAAWRAQVKGIGVRTHQGRSLVWISVTHFTHQSPRRPGTTDDTRSITQSPV